MAASDPCLGCARREGISLLQFLLTSKTPIVPSATIAFYLTIEVDPEFPHDSTNVKYTSHALRAARVPSLFSSSL